MEELNCSLTSELIKDFLSYSTAIFGRSLPDCIDGLKVAQRRSLVGIKDLGLWSTSPYCKVSRLEGHVLGRYHPNGGCANTIINLGQQSAQRYALTDIHGNCGGSIQTGPCAGQKVSADGPAAARYLEVRATPFSEAIYLSQIDKKLGEWRSNYDGSTSEPIRLIPSLPALLLTGSTGIAAGYAANHIPYNVQDVVAATCAWVENKKITDPKLFAKFKLPPEPPQGGRVLKNEQFFEAWNTGKGQIEVYGKWELEDKVRYGKRSTRPAIIITHLANGSSEEFVDKVHELAEKEKLPGLISVSDHSTRTGIRVELIVGEVGVREAIINTLLDSSTGLKYVHNVNATAVGVNGKPSLYGVKRVIEEWYEQRVNYLCSKHRRDREKVGEEVERLRGVEKIVKSIDRFLRLVRSAKDKPSAIEGVAKGWKLSRDVAEYVISIPISTLIATELSKVLDKLQGLESKAKELDPLCDPGPALDKFIVSELKSLKSLTTPARAEWLEARPVIKATPLPQISSRDRIVSEAKSLGLSPRTINKWIRENVGKGIEAKWAEYRDSVLKSSHEPHPSNSAPSPPRSSKSRGGKTTVRKRASGTAGKKSSRSSGGQRPVASQARNPRGSRSGVSSGTRSRTVSGSGGSKGRGGSARRHRSQDSE